MKCKTCKKYTGKTKEALKFHFCLMWKEKILTQFTWIRE